MPGRGGFQARGPRRPDPQSVEPGDHHWAVLMRRVYDELYERGEPAERPTLTALADAAHVHKSYVSQIFSGKKHPQREVFLSLVRALGGNPSQWEPRWHAAVAQTRAGERGDGLRLPGVDDETPEAAVPGAVPGWPARRHLTRRFLRMVMGWLVTVATWPTRMRSDKAAAKLRRRMLKRVRAKTADEIRRAESHYYLCPRFVIWRDPEGSGTGRTTRGRRTRRSEPVRVPASETEIRVLFDDVDEVVVLGRPGLGKTTQLARLGHQLAVEALEQNSSAEPSPIPVFLSLDSYRGEPMEEWLVSAMGRGSYELPAVLVRTWLSRRQLLPVLDGLDEVPEAERPRCVEELRRLRVQCPGIAIGCRTDEADLRRLARSIGALRYAELLPPTRQDVQDFLACDIEALKDVSAALEADPDLWPLLQSPMVLNVIHVAYRNRSAAELREPGSLTDRRGRIFDTYIRRCLADGRPGAYDEPERTLHWLTWLARTLTERGEHVLHLDRLDLTWLSPAQQVLPKSVPNVVMSAVALGVPLVWVVVATQAGVIRTSLSDAAAFAVAMALTIAGQAYRSEKHYATSPSERGSTGPDEPGSILIPFGANMPVMLFNFFWLVVLLRADLTAPGVLVIGLGYLWVTATQFDAAFTDVYSPVEQLRWTWRRQERTLWSPTKQNYIRGIVTIFLVVTNVLLFGYVLHLLCPDPWWIGPAATLPLGVLYAFGNQLEPSLQDRRPRPNEGIRRTLRFSLIQGISTCLLIGLALFALITLTSPQDDRARSAWFVALLLGSLYGLARAFRYGGLAILRHWTIRAVLAQSGSSPYRYRRFLHTAEQRILLYRADSGFSFPHRLLQLHMNTTAAELLPRVTPRRE
ncbi:NACHT domain-containing protein [Streptomyces sp. PKU-EA00015]|uniref:helix-turn-helix domain-containing protein n=1 Tax=Streptomyces sp. PKU-EA00015 TaxID=2748326 RepID=UPI0015A1416F|nr:helix-turn-helix transcriptional regulator [Streptomyces sp. PKU-EA00015]NWF27386.1 NACHT domain-containing protein [Streptomyces sp. PKU-EA00015]